jgi:hypothetical protein
MLSRWPYMHIQSFGCPRVMQTWKFHVSCAQSWHDWVSVYVTHMFNIIMFCDVWQHCAHQTSQFLTYSFLFTFLLHFVTNSIRIDQSSWQPTKQHWIRITFRAPLVSPWGTLSSSQRPGTWRLWYSPWFDR